MSALAGLVKPLEWHKSHFNSWNGDWHTIPTGYTIRFADENGWKWQCNGGFGYSYSDAAAKAAAQADYEARILSALNLPMLTALSEDASKAAELERALEPFALVAEHDIGDDEDDSDAFRPMQRNHRAPKITVGHMRRARAALDAKP